MMPYSAACRKLTVCSPPQKAERIMSRAFVSEGGGWGFCREKNRECMFADETGICCVNRCKYSDKDSEKGDENKHDADA